MNFGILGTGAAARGFAQGLLAVREANVTAVGSRSEDSASRFARDFGIARAHTSYGDLAEDTSVDVVYIATPPGLHRENALTCLQAGKAVLIEKPFAPNAAEASDIIDAARQSKLFCMEAMWTRFVPVTRRFMARARSGEIGDLHHFSADFGGPVAFDVSSHRCDSVAGGAWLDRGIYGLSLAMALFGEPLKVQSSALVADTGCDLQCDALLSFSDQRSAVVSASMLAYTSNEAVLAGSLGRLRLAEPFIRSEVIRSRSMKQTQTKPAPQRAVHGMKQVVKSMRAARRLASMVPKERIERSFFVGNGYGYEAIEVARCLEAGLIESSMMPLEETRTIMEVSDAVRATWLPRTLGDL